MKQNPSSWRALGLIFAFYFSFHPFSASGQELTVTDGLQLWLRGDAGVTVLDGKVIGWDDQSLSLNNAAAASDEVAPLLIPNALNGKPVLRFDGVDDYLTIPDADSLSLANDLTTFFVVKFADFSGYNTVWAKTASNQPAPNDWYTLPNTGVPRVFRGNGILGGAGFADGLALKAGEFLVVGWDAEATQINHFLGDQVSNGGIVTAFPVDANTSLLIGSRDDFVTKMKGDIAEILIYDRALSAAERSSVVAYLGAKYNITNLNPTVSLSALPVATTVDAGTTVTLTAAASDPDGSVTKVEFFLNGASLAIASAPPYKINVKLATAGTYNFTARATDNRSGLGESTVLTRTATASGGIPTLTVLTNLQLWLKADAGVDVGGASDVTGWADQSGNANNAGAADANFSPLLIPDGMNGHPSLRFDGIDDYLEIPDSDSLSITGDITTFWVAKFDDLSSYRTVWAKTIDNKPGPTDWWTINQDINVWRGNGTVFGSVRATTGLVAGVPEVIGFTMEGTQVTHFLNGAANGAGAIGATVGDADGPVYIGTRSDFVTRMKGDISEILIYNTALSEADRLSVQSYLAGKYGVSTPTGTVVNLPPTVSLAVDPNQTNVTAGATVTLTATAADTDGSVTQVQFFSNDLLLGTSTEAPFSLQVTLSTSGVFNFHVQAVDNLGASTASSNLTLTATGPGAPLTVANSLQLWLKADAGVTTGGANDVITWADQSGNENIAAAPDTTNSPLLVSNGINGQPVLRFDGVDDYLEIPDSDSLSIAGDITSFFVMTFDDLDFYRVIWAKTGPNALAAPTDWWTIGTAVNLFRGDGDVFGAVGATNPFVAGVPQLAGFTMAGPNVTHYLNGQPNGTGAITSPVADTDMPLRIGTRGDLGTRMKGDIAEILIYDRALSSSEIANVQQYLAGKYSIPLVTLPVPELKVTRAGTQVTVSWPAGYPNWTLESTSDLALPFEAITGVVNHTLTETVTAKKFYRLKQK